MTLDALHTIMSRYGFVERIVMFDKGTGLQVLVQFPHSGAAVGAYEGLDLMEM